MVSPWTRRNRPKFAQTLQSPPPPQPTGPGGGRAPRGGCWERKPGGPPQTAPRWAQGRGYSLCPHLRPGKAVQGTWAGGQHGARATDGTWHSCLGPGTHGLRTVMSEMGTRPRSTRRPACGPRPVPVRVSPQTQPRRQHKQPGAARAPPAGPGAGAPSLHGTVRGCEVKQWSGAGQSRRQTHVTEDRTQRKGRGDSGVTREQAEGTRRRRGRKEVRKQEGAGQAGAEEAGAVPSVPSA